MSVIVLRGDAAHLPLPDASVDLLLCSPPYFGQRQYADDGQPMAGQIGNEETPTDYIAALLRCTTDWIRVLKPGGNLFVNLSDKFTGSGGDGNSGLLSPKYKGNVAAVPPGKGKRYGRPPKSLLGLPWRYALGCMDDLGLILRRDIIWHKTNGQPESAGDRCQTSHEYLFHLVRQPRHYATVDSIREPHKRLGRKAGASAFQARNASQPRSSTGQYDGQNPPGKLPGSVWEIASYTLMVPAHLGVDHFAAWPPEICRRIILGWSPPGGRVADPFGGTGTSAVVADVLGRTGISIDRSLDYCRLAQWRTVDPGERAAALGVPKPPPAPKGMDALFDLEAS